MESVFCAIDMGGTKILLLLVDPCRKVLYSEKMPTPIGTPPGEVIELLGKAVYRALGDMGLSGKSLAAVGVCSAGLVGHPSGIIYQSPNIGWHKAVPFLELLSNRFSCPVYLENDANAAVLGEVHFGAARGHRDVIYVTLSTGIGGGLYLDGELYRGSSGFAGEIGHIKSFGKGRRCGCGGDNCLEAWAGGSSVSRSAQELWGENGLPPGDLSTEWVFKQAREGNPLARNIVMQALEDIGTGLANLVTVFNPSCLVIGGGMTAGMGDFLEHVRTAVKRSATRPSVETTPLKILPAELEPEAGIWGMFSLMNKETEEKAV